jgi:hypothetical protein
MAQCPSCDYPLPDDRDRAGARCPNCRDPLYEPPGRFGRPVREGDGACAVHAESEAVGACGRCGNYLCETCRSQWRGQILCAACVDRALESKEAAPEQARAFFAQAATSVGLTVGAWILSVVGLMVAVLLVSSAGGPTAPGAVVGALIFFGGFGLALPAALFGVGLALAVLRARGGSMILASIGLVAGCLLVGTAVGLIAFGVFNQA